MIHMPHREGKRHEQPRRRIAARVAVVLVALALPAHALADDPPPATETTVPATTQPTATTAPPATTVPSTPKPVTVTVPSTGPAPVEVTVPSQAPTRHTTPAPRPAPAPVYTRPAVAPTPPPATTSRPKATHPKAKTKPKRTTTRPATMPKPSPKPKTTTTATVRTPKVPAPAASGSGDATSRATQIGWVLLGALLAIGLGLLALAGAPRRLEHAHGGNVLAANRTTVGVLGLALIVIALFDWLLTGLR